MKKQAMLISGVLLSLLLLFTGCSRGQGAEDTGEDGHVANGSRTTASTSEKANGADDDAGGLMDNSMIP